MDKENTYPMLNDPEMKEIVESFIIETKEILDNLKAERDTLNIKLTKIENRSERNWEEFKTELEQDMGKFSSKVKEFFKNYM